MFDEKWYGRKVCWMQTQIIYILLFLLIHYWRTFLMLHSYVQTFVPQFARKTLQFFIVICANNHLARVTLIWNILIIFWQAVLSGNGDCCQRSLVEGGASAWFVVWFAAGFQSRSSPSMITETKYWSFGDRAYQHQIWRTKDDRYRNHCGIPLCRRLPTERWRYLSLLLPLVGGKRSVESHQQWRAPCNTSKCPGTAGCKFRGVERKLD